MARFSGTSDGVERQLTQNHDVSEQVGTLVTSY